ncbi:cyclic nucleotide-binding domain-containing protein [Flammeovirgaceae bacterium SG7u.111]|nr:cyclic nucleotide-binding domain-containing protein [Flammeovirgaceae bacterium SG7u.132]WPO37016.1 cyclic nucleotide-binding domain-containing protein [Flammeovirgaceae bacterium SG7u.111]
MKFFNPFKKTYSNDDKAMFRFLLKNVLFEKLEPGELAEFLPYIHERTYKKDEVIFFRGDPSQALYIIHEGEVGLNLDIEDNFEELVRLGSTQSFGENALLESKNRIYNAVCTSDKSNIYVIASTNIQEIFDRNVDVQAKIMTALAEYYNKYTVNLFRAYQESFGFFDMGRAFMKG